jgi:hypothetical protein
LDILGWWAEFSIRIGVAMNFNTLLHKNGLCRCQSSFGTDKNFIHSYLSEFYEPLFELIDPPRKFLEIGIARGASLLFWQKALPNTFLFAIDNNTPEAMHPDFKLLLGDDRIKVLFGDAYQGNLIPLNSYDVIIDDGPHTLSSQIEALTFIDMLSPNGILIIEDVPDVAKRYSTLKSMIPNKDTCHLRAISFSHLSGRFDDSLIVFSRNAKIADWVEKEFSGKKHSYAENQFLCLIVMKSLVFSRILRKFRGRSRKNDHSK